LAPVTGFDHRKAFSLKTGAQQCAHFRLVVNDEDCLLIA
jgi:hypothetical protein